MSNPLISIVSPEYRGEKMVSELVCPITKYKHDGRDLSNCDRFADCLVRLPMFYELNEGEVERICGVIKKW